MSTVQCPKCQGFTTEKMRDAFLESPDIFDDSFHSKIKCDSTDELLEYHNAMIDYIYALRVITMAVKYRDAPIDKALNDITKLVEEIRYGGWRYVNR